MLRRQISFMSANMVANNLSFKEVEFGEISAYAARMNEECESGDIGYYHLPNIGEDIIDEVHCFMSGKEFEDVVLIGIGGSSLGVRALESMLIKRHKKGYARLHFLDNVDDFSFNEVAKGLKFDKTLFLISSKSGTTIETITLFKLILDKFSVTNLKDNFLFITDENSVLEKFASQNGAKFIHIPSNVGGRFSVLSAVGLAPLTICGYDCKEILNGAKECKKRYFKGDDKLLQKAYHYATHKSANINVIFSYCDRLKLFNDWYVQLWAESLGKKDGYNRIGLTPIGLVGSRDQHSFLQLIMDGPKDKTVTFIKIKDQGETKIPNLKLSGLEGCDFVNSLGMSELLNAQCDATMRAVLNEGVSVDEMVLERLDEWHCGYLMYYYELLTSATGLMLGINTYDQPGVEAGKIILKTLLSR